MKPVLISLGVTLGLASGVAAQSMPTAALEFLDTNDDVLVTQDEMVRQMDLFFGPMDSNGNGRLEYGEVEAFMPRELFDGADANGNGTLSQAEYRAQVIEDFQSADIDGDGVLE
ncbi:hypothetical protein ACFORG_15805 [Lutimaribacter marinistellae]|uniref:EF-hand domain-containing protein n=1 Tax=Lutimaribacter marinistellae TaxID=1820329 RepID=A0ABV7TJ65_9RHOB